MIPEWFVLIPWYTKYFINNQWKIWRMPWKSWFCFKEWRFLTPTKNEKRWGYLYVSLQEKWIKRKNWLLHRLVAITFIPNPDNLPQINHIDWNKSNVSVKNLEWVTDKDNKKHWIENGFLYQCAKKCRYKKDWKFLYYR